VATGAELGVAMGLTGNHVIVVTNDITYAGSGDNGWSLPIGGNKWVIGRQVYFTSDTGLGNNNTFIVWWNNPVRFATGNYQLTGTNGGGAVMNFRNMVGSNTTATITGISTGAVLNYETTRSLTLVGGVNITHNKTLWDNTAENGTFLKTANGTVNALTTKTTPVGLDVLLIEDSATSYSQKKILISSLPTGSTVPIIYVSTPAELEAAIVLAQTNKTIWLTVPITLPALSIVWGGFKTYFYGEEMTMGGNGQTFAPAVQNSEAYFYCSYVNLMPTNGVLDMQGSGQTGMKWWHRRLSVTNGNLYVIRAANTVTYEQLVPATTTIDVSTTATITKSQWSNTGILSGLLTAGGQVIASSAAGTPVAVAAGTTGYVLKSNGPNPPTFQAISTSTTTSISYLVIDGINAVFVKDAIAEITVTLKENPTLDTELKIKNKGTVYNVVVARNSSLIDGAASDITLTPGMGVILYCDGTNSWETF
jgi:hypothetical protein